MLYGLLTIVEISLLVYCVLDVIRTPEDQVRNLPKLLWLLLVVLLPLAGGVAWLFAGRPASGGGRSVPYKGNTGQPPRGPVRAGNPDDDEEFLRSLRRRAEEQRRKAQEDKDL